MFFHHVQHSGRGARIAPALKEIQRELVLGIDHPHKQEAIALQLRHRQINDVIICQLAVAQSHSYSTELLLLHVLRPSRSLTAG